MWDAVGSVVQTLVSRADENGIPDIDDPWATKDVSLLVLPKVEIHH